MLKFNVPNTDCRMSVSFFELPVGEFKRTNYYKHDIRNFGSFKNQWNNRIYITNTVFDPKIYNFEIPLHVGKLKELICSKSVLFLLKMRVKSKSVTKID